MPEGPNFTPKKEIKKRAQGWQSSFHDNENGVRYMFNRLDEGAPFETETISQLHGVSFIKDVIPGLIAKKKNGEKVNILDIGAGAGAFTDEIRKTFGDQVNVTSTGLSKRSAENFRKARIPDGAPYKLHPDDLKWRSIIELSDFPEFDLMVDSYGEFTYMREEPGVYYDMDQIMPRVIDYLTIVAKKLKPGGVASIAPFDSIDLANPKMINFVHDIERANGVKIHPLADHHDTLRIEKKEK